MPKTQPSIRPTNTCFDDALDFLDMLSRTVLLDRLRQYTLVHGICLVPDNGRPYAHGWVELEKDSIVFQAALIDGVRTYYTTPRAVFHVIHRPQKVTRYTVDEAAKLNHDTDSYGPWEDEYRQLCSPLEPQRHRLGDEIQVIVDSRSRWCLR